MFASMSHGRNQVRRTALFVPSSLLFSILDGYAESQRRRVLRDSQGYYFPYKAYTLRDYRDLQKFHVQVSRMDANEALTDRVDTTSLA